MRRRKKHSEEHVDESWLLPYSDLLTLLLALFIVLFATSSIDAKKFEQMGNAFKKIVDEGAAGNQAHVAKSKDPTNISADAIEKAMAAQDKQKSAAASKKALEKQNKMQLEAFKKKLDSYISTEHLEAKLSTRYANDGLLITIRDDILFDSGSAELSASKRKIAKEIGMLFKQGDSKMEGIISGHTDNVPIHTATYKSNWELSAARAVNFMEAIITENTSLDPGLFSARGYGEYKPVAKNDNAVDREKNRRVEIMVRPLNNKVEEE